MRTLIFEINIVIAGNPWISSSFAPLLLPCLLSCKLWPTRTDSPKVKAPNPAAIEGSVVRIMEALVAGTLAKACEVIKPVYKIPPKARGDATMAEKSGSRKANSLAAAPFWKRGVNSNMQSSMA